MLKQAWTSVSVLEERQMYQKNQWQHEGKPIKRFLTYIRIAKVRHPGKKSKRDNEDKRFKIAMEMVAINNIPAHLQFGLLMILQIDLYVAKVQLELLGH